MGFNTYKFSLPKRAYQVETELNLGFCKEIQRGVKEGLKTHKVPWNMCTKIKNNDPNPENRMLDISVCKKQKGYDVSHDCLDGILDISKCMEGNVHS